MKHILNTSWRDLADFFYEGHTSVIPSKNCVVFCHTDQLPTLFKALNNRSTKHIVISADSDYGVASQKEDPVWADMNKWLKFAQFNKEDGYAPMVVPTRCQAESCKITDELSLKMYSWTKETFNFSDIPDNIVKLFVTNWTGPELSYNRLLKIPFGISHTMESVIKKQEKEAVIKEDKLYVNFTFNTIERYDIFKAMQFFNYTRIESGVTPEQYAKSLAECKSCLCMEGNGKDSYRILESLYLKTLPLIVVDLSTSNNKSWVNAYEGLPYAICFGDLNTLSSSCISGFQKYSTDYFNLENSRADLNRWERIIQECKEKLL